MRLAVPPLAPATGRRERGVVPALLRVGSGSSLARCCGLSALAVPLGRWEPTLATRTGLWPLAPPGLGTCDPIRMLPARVGLVVRMLPLLRCDASRGLWVERMEETRASGDDMLGLDVGRLSGSGTAFG